MSNNFPLVSIIIPVYNGKDYISDCIESCLHQTYSNIEIIVINDGSTDGIEKVVEPYIISNKINFITQENKERSAARNNGLNHAKGSYIQFLDCDDKLMPSKIEKQVDFLENNPNFFATYCKTNYFDNNHKVVGEQKIQNYSGDISQQLLKGNFMTTHSLLLRKSVLRFDENMSFQEDWDYWLRSTDLNNNFHCLNEILCQTRVRQEGVLENNSKMLKGMLLFLDKHQNRFSKGEYLYRKTITYYLAKKREEFYLNIKNLLKIDVFLAIKLILKILKLKISG